MKNKTGMNEDDAMRIHQLMDLAAENEWYDLAQKLRDARELLRQRLKTQWIDGIIHDLEHGNDLSS